MFNKTPYQASQSVAADGSQMVARGMGGQKLTLKSWYENGCGLYEEDEPLESVEDDVNTATFMQTREEYLQMYLQHQHPEKKQQNEALDDVIESDSLSVDELENLEQEEEELFLYDENEVVHETYKEAEASQKKFSSENGKVLKEIDLNAEDVSSGQSDGVECVEKFLEWLKTSNDRNVTAIEIVEFKSLLNIIKTGGDI